ncbi:MAG: T9SS type A sorting domain-containing protein, partial [Flavobacteriales bacterium]|nr:T9SS type A sorting domain-containing protein [Flavobacteriales bacterium]
VLYPNPVLSNEAHLSWPAEQGYGQLVMRNIQGQMLWSSQISLATGETNIPVFGLASGLYLIEWQTPSSHSVLRLIRE